MPVDMKRYPENWRKFSDEIRFVRAGGRCECRGECGLHSAHPGPRRCVEVHGEPAKWAKGKVVLTVAHTCKCDPLCANPEHVLAMCQRCHNRMDISFRVSNRVKNLRIRLESAGQMTMTSDL